MANKNYQLLDFGSGRKLEQFGSVVLDRPCPAADLHAVRDPNQWSNADLVLPKEDESHRLPSPWPVEFLLRNDSPQLSLELGLKLTPFGHVGVFPEQLAQWRWLVAQVTQAKVSSLRALNLFAYTGGSTLALAAAGAQVTHVDASAPAVAWARENATTNQLDGHPIRWIVEDASKFVAREIRRGNAYDIIVLDPPSYGHGPSGKAWNLSDQWEELFSGCMKLLESSLIGRILWTGHSDVPSPLMLERAMSELGWQTESGRSQLQDKAGRFLDAGYYVRAFRPQSD